MNSLSHQECGTDRGGGLYIYFRKIHLALETRTYQVFSCIYRILPLYSPSSHHDEGLSLEPGAFSWLAQKLSDCACLCSLMLESQAHRAMPGIQIRSFCLQSKCSYPPSQFPKCPFEGDWLLTRWGHGSCCACSPAQTEGPPPYRGNGVRPQWGGNSHQSRTQMTGLLLMS